MRSNRKVIIAAILCFSITLIGTSGYVLIEDYNLFEGLYMTVITLSSVGYGEVKELSGAGRGFTTILIIIGFGVFAFTAHTLVESLLENVWKGKMETKKMKKKLSRLKSHFIICGYGRVGAAAADYFNGTGTPFAIIETNPNLIPKIKEKGFPFVEGDCTRESILLEAGIKFARGILALLNSDPDNLFIGLTARELNPLLYIIARAEESSSEKKILKAGADSVISPFTTAGKQIANDILMVTGMSGHLDDFAGLKNVAPRWIAIEEGSSMISKPVSSVSSEMGRKIIGLRRKDRDFIFPDSKTVLRGDDEILVFDDEQNSGEKMAQFSIERQKLVIVDDNPIILQLYTRLFQQRGFIPITATNGHEGLDIIVQEKPVAAVIDFMLPVLSGIELCRQIRKKGKNHDIKLILFTSDNHPETRKLALDAGADEIVIKSSDAPEIIETVIRSLKTEAGQRQSEAKTLQEDPPVNIERFLERLSGDETLLRKIMIDFLDNGQDQIKIIRQAITNGDAEVLEREAHSIKGSSLELAARDCSKFASALENIGKSGKTDKGGELIEELEKEFSRIEVYLKENLDI